MNAQGALGGWRVIVFDRVPFEEIGFDEGWDKPDSAEQHGGEHDCQAGLVDGVAPAEIVMGGAGDVDERHEDGGEDEESDIVEILVEVAEQIGKIGHAEIACASVVCGRRSGAVVPAGRPSRAIRLSEIGRRALPARRPSVGAAPL